MVNVEVLIMGVHELVVGINKNTFHIDAQNVRKLENPCKCKEINRTLLDSFIVNQLFTTILNPQHLETSTSES